MSSSSSSPDVVGALDRLESLLAGGAAAMPSTGTDPAVVRWLCLVPAWTPALALRCGMPSFAEPHDVVLDAWRGEGLVECMTSPLTMDATGQVLPAQELFWARRDSRASRLAQVLAEDGRAHLSTLAGDIARRILAVPRDAHVPTATWRWAMLAAQATGTTQTLGATFEHEITQALARQQPEEAWAWIESLQRVAEVVPGEATMLQQRAVRQLALFDRQRSDLALLRDYLPRPALFDAYRALLTGPDSEWALHYLGGGGVGKTMLMRALTSGTPAHLPPGMDLPPTVTARIDFDHINPDYPARRPGLLFAHLAEELRLKDEGLRASEGFSLLFRKIGLLHERPESERTTDAEIDDMLEVFAWACEELARSRGARVVLLLDTCEELARLGSDGRLPDSIERTFDLLTRLHARLPAIRVVFCGRRPLASAYAGDAHVTTDLPARPWLALQRVHPFSEDEARTYLSRVHVPVLLVDPILMRSTAAASSAAIGVPAEAGVARYSPFSLSVYAAWVARQRDLTPAAILDDPIDHFVRIRILDRIHNADVRGLLPHIALLGRFDEATLRACADLRADVSDAVLRELGAQEWVDRQAGGYYSLEDELRSRLLRYFASEAPGELARARARILPVLGRLLEAGGAQDVPDEAVVQALTELVPHDREQLLAVWRTLDARIVGGGHASWGTRVLGRLLADEHGLGSSQLDPGAWAAFVTTFLECAQRTQGATAGADLWPRAWERARHLVDATERSALLVRIAAGALVASTAGPADAGAIDRWAVRLYNVVADREAAPSLPAHLAPAIAALMASADALDREGNPLVPAEPMLERVAAVMTEVRHGASRALALACVGRFSARRQDADHARKRFGDALETITGTTERDLPPCLQWPAGLDAASWVVLESLRGLAGLETVEETLVRWSTLPPVRSAAAANRIEALRLRLSSAMRVTSGDATASGDLPVLGPGTTRGDIRPDDVAPVESVGQAMVPPRAVAVALDLVERGHPTEGLRLLDELTSLATSARNTTVATAAEAARVDAVLRMRLGEHGRLSRQLGSGGRTIGVEARERIRAFTGDDTTFNPESTAQFAVDDEAVTTRAEAHAVWRARRAFTDAERRELAGLGPRLFTLGNGQDEWATACVALDLVECSELGGDVSALTGRLVAPSPEDWWSRHPALPAHALRLWVRSAALGVSPGGPTSQLVRRIGVRRAAAIALEEGELLALRLPAPALRLLALALTWFEDAGDRLGTWQVQALLAMTRVRADVPREAVDLAGLRAAHDAMTGRGVDRGYAGFPPWDRLVEAMQLPLPDGAAAEWTPWFHRVIALHQWVTAGVRPEVLFARPDQVPLELRAWPTAAPGDNATTETTIATGAVTGPRTETGNPPQPVSGGDPFAGAAYSLPVPRPSVESTTVQTLPPPASWLPDAPAARPRASWLPWVGMILALALLLLLAFGAIWTATRSRPPVVSGPVVSTGEPIDGPRGTAAIDPAPAAAEPPAPADPAGAERPASGVAQAAPSIPGDAVSLPEGQATTVWPGIVVGLLLLAAGASWLWIRRSRTATAGVAPGTAPLRAWQAVVASATDPASGRAGALDATVTLHDEAGRVVTSAPLRMRRSDAYAGLDALRQPPAGTVLATALREAAHVGRVDLLVSGRAAWPCWEALLWSGVVEGASLPPPVVRHVQSGRRARPIVPVQGRMRVAVVAASAGEARQATYAWEASVKAARVAIEATSGEQVREGVPVPGVGLAHVVAPIAETPQGLFAEITGSDALQGESLESLQGDRGTLFDASQLAHVFPEASCVILQPPRRASLELTPAGREGCASARLFGAALAEQGVPIVVVLPPLDGELGAHVVRLIGRRVPSLAAGMPFDTFAFVLRARQLVFDHAHRLLPRDAAIELALQVAVYVA